MSDSSRRPGNRARWASDHERARQRAAERLSLPLPAAENGWLDGHLRICPACAAVAGDYASQQAALRALEEPIPPRDLWARTSTALDRAERQARDMPNPSVFPGRGGQPGSRGARSIRGLRAEQRASAFRAGGRAAPPHLLVDPRYASRPAGIGWVAPFGALAALAIVVVVGGTALLANSFITPPRGPLATAAGLRSNGGAPFATPIQVGAGDVAWLTLADDGTYSLNYASVDQVCPANAQPDCAPIAPSSPHQLPTVRSALHTVLRDPSHTQLVVMTAGTKKRSGGSLYVVTVPLSTSAVTPGPTVEPVSASIPATPTAVVTATIAIGSEAPSSTQTPTVTAAVGPTASSVPTPSRQPVGSAGSPGAPTPSPTAAATPPAPSAPPGSPVFPSGSTASGSVTPGSPVPTTAASGDSSPLVNSPEPTASAVEIIANIVVVGETASYSPDGTMLAFSARPADGSQGPDIYLWRIGDPLALPLTSNHASIFSGWLGNQLLGSRAVDGSGQPAASFTLAEASPGASGPGDPPGAESPSPSVPASLVPRTPSASAPVSAADVPGATEAPTASDPADPTAVFPRSFMLDPVTGIETELAVPAWRPVVDPTGRFVAYWAGSVRYDPSSLTWLPNTGVLVLAAWPALRDIGPSATLAPVPLLDNDAASVPAGEWDIRWDESGTHVAIWAADAADPEVGRLSLLTIDPFGRIDPNGVSLHGTPALAGFSMGRDRLAWATPPGQDGEGSRLQVLAWSGENAGQIDGQPASGGDWVVVVR